MARLAKSPKDRDANITFDEATGRWDVDVQIMRPDGKRWRRRKRGFETKKAALEARNGLYEAYNLEVLGIREEGARVASGGPTLHAWLDECLAVHWPASVPQSLGGYKTSVQQWVKPHFPDVPIKDISSRDLKRQMDQFAAARPDLSVASLRNAKAALSSALTLAVEHGHLERNPFRDVKISWRTYERARVLEGRGRKRKEVLSREEVLRIIEAAREQGSIIHPVLLVQGLLGLRLGEALALRKGDFDFGRKEVHITRQLKRIVSADRPSRLAEVPPKTDAGRRTIPCPEAVLALARQADDLICPNREGRWLDIDNMGTRISEFVKGLGHEGFASHSLRHAFISYLLNEKGIPPTIVKELAGHSSVAVTLGYYSIATEAQLRNAMND
jgi:integrase